MADADRPTVDINLLIGDSIPFNFPLLQAGDNLAGKGLVKLNTVYLCSLKTGMLESQRSGYDGTDTHDLLFDSRHSPNR